MPTNGLYFSCRIGDLPANTFNVVEFTLREGLSALFTLSIKVVSRQPDIDAEEQLLKRATLTVLVNSAEQRTVHGVVAELMQGDSGFRRTYYTLTIRPSLWTLTLSQDSRIYHLSTVPEILSGILRDFSVRSQCQFVDSHPRREYTTMKRESYYAFFCRLAAEEGIAFWFEGNQMYYSDTHLTMKADVAVSYNPHPQSARQGDIIHRLSFGAVMQPGDVANKDYTYHNPRLPLQHDKTVSHELWQQYGLYESYGRYQTDEDGERLTQYRLESVRANSQQGTAHSNCIKLAPGKIFTLADHPNAKMNDRWQVVTAVHHGKQPAALEEESDQTGTTLTNEITFIPGKTDWRPPYHYKPLADGDELATVVGPANEEIYVNQDGAVRVHFHWNRYDEASDTASCWVRVAQGWNGSGYGFMATPRIGQEVIVSYLNGDIDRPIITGCTYNAINRPPLDLPKEKTRTTFKTKTHKGSGFNELRFDDEADREEIYIHAQRDIKTEINRQQTVLVGGSQFTDIKKDKHLRVEGEVRDEVLKDYSLTVSQDSHVQVKQKYLVEGGEEIHLHSGQKVIIDAGEEIVLKVGSSFISITSAGVFARPTIDINTGTPNLGTPVAARLPEQLEKAPEQQALRTKYFNFSD